MILFPGTEKFAQMRTRFWNKGQVTSEKAEQRGCGVLGNWNFRPFTVFTWTVAPIIREIIGTWFHSYSLQMSLRMDILIGY